MFSKKIDTCLNFYKLDPCHYFISPRLSWELMLKMTGEKLEKIIDFDMYLFIVKELTLLRDTLLRYTLKQIKNIWKIMIQKNCYGS